LFFAAYRDHHVIENCFINWWFRYGREKHSPYSTTESGITKSPDAGSGLDEVKYGYLLFVHNRYAHINLPTMRGLNMMMVVLERGLVIHVGRYSMPGRGMSQGEMEKSPSTE
jgi:hypothetical protein